jgi:hypothetical protein
MKHLLRVVMVMPLTNTECERFMMFNISVRTETAASEVGAAESNIYNDLLIPSL